MSQTIESDSAHSVGGRRVDQLLEHYGLSHRVQANEQIHFVAIPLIMWSLLGLLYALHPWLAYATVALSMVYYARLSVAFLAAMLLVAVLMLGLVRLMGDSLVLVCLVVFVGAWIAQFVGHKIEGKKPSFFEDLQYLLVGPLFVLSKLFLKLGIRW